MYKSFHDKVYLFCCDCDLELLLTLGDRAFSSALVPLFSSSSSSSSSNLTPWGTFFLFDNGLIMLIPGLRLRIWLPLPLMLNFFSTSPAQLSAALVAGVLLFLSAAKSTPPWPLNFSASSLLNRSCRAKSRFFISTWLDLHSPARMVRPRWLTLLTLSSTKSLLLGSSNLFSSYLSALSAWLRCSMNSSRETGRLTCCLSIRLARLISFTCVAKTRRPSVMFR